MSEGKESLCSASDFLLAMGQAEHTWPTCVCRPGAFTVDVEDPMSHLKPPQPQQGEPGVRRSSRAPSVP